MYIYIQYKYIYTDIYRYIYILYIYIYVYMFEHIRRSTVWNVTKFVFIECPNGGLPKRIKTKASGADHFFVP